MRRILKAPELNGSFHDADARGNVIRHAVGSPLGAIHNHLPSTQGGLT